MTDDNIIPLFEDHPNRTELKTYGSPFMDMYAWNGTLDAKAWDGDILLCFFADIELGDRIRYVIEFLPEDNYRPTVEGYDMRKAELHRRYEIHVQCTEDGPVPTVVESLSDSGDV